MKRFKSVATLGAVGFGLFACYSASAQAPALPEGPGKATVAQNCTACHGPEVITAQRRTTEEWTDVVNRMMGNGAALTDDQVKEVVAYLGTYLGKTPGAGAAPGSPDAASKPASGTRSNAK